MNNTDAVKAQRKVAALEDDEVERQIFDWHKWAFPKQLPPPGDWTTWLLMGGRGSGKTRAGAEWVRQLARDRVTPIGLVGETITEALDIMVRGESGLLAVHPEKERPVLRNKTRLVWPNGVEAVILTASDPERFRGPQFAAAWCDEVGCGAVDRAANQPNIFGDAKSVEGGRPYFSSGLPDALIQRQFLRAHHRYWADPVHNPAGMLDSARIYCWTWDARPYPAFPAMEDVWTDGPNHRTGHWLTGRLGAVASDELLSAIAQDHGLEIQSSAASPLIGGMVRAGPETARQAIEPVLELTAQMLRADAGVLRAQKRGAGAQIALEQSGLADDRGAVVVHRRAAIAERPGRLALAHMDRERDYLTATATALRRGEGPLVADTMPVVLDSGGARQAAERLLNERAASGDSISLSLPPNSLGIEPGDRLLVEGQGERHFVVSEIRDGLVRRIVASSEPQGEASATGIDRPRAGPGAPAADVPPVVVTAHLPPASGQPERSRLLIGAYARPWPAEPALDHAPEAWRLSVIAGGTIRRVLEPASTSAVYSPAQQAADFGGPAPAFTYTIAQVSPLLGPGHLATGEFHG